MDGRSLTWSRRPGPPNLARKRSLLAHSNPKSQPLDWGQLATAGQPNWQRLQRASEAASDRTLLPWRRKCPGPVQVGAGLGNLI